MGWITYLYPKSNVGLAKSHLDVLLQWRHNEPDSVSNHRRLYNSIVCSGADQRKHQSSAPLALVRGIHLSPVNSPHKGPVTRKMFPFDDVIMKCTQHENINIIAHPCLRCKLNQERKLQRSQFHCDKTRYKLLFMMRRSWCNLSWCIINEILRW